MAQARFLSGNLFRHVATMSLTSSVGLTAVFAVDFIDMVFISMLGKAALAAAVGYAGAVLFFTSAFGIGMAIAGGALVARALGEGQPAAARRKATHVLIYGALFAAGFALIVWLNLRPIVQLVGATGETADLAVHYLAILVPFLPLLVLGMIGGAILRAHGAARLSMMATIWAGLANAILDPILIFGLNMELTGAALASVAARIVMVAAALYPIWRYHGGFSRLTPRRLMADLPPIFTIAIPAILTQLATPVGQAYVTRAMAEFGEAAVAGMAVISRLMPVSFAVIFALSGAVGPIIGQNAGAGLTDRVRGTYRAALGFTLGVVVLISALLFLLRWPIAGLFQAEGITLQLILLFCGPLALAYVFNGVIFVSNASFNNLGHPFYSTWINWGRHTLGTIPFVIVFAAWLGAPGVLIGQAVGGAIFAALALGLALRVISAADSDAGRPLFQRRGKEHELLNHRR
ncbi:MAG: MATE family efflux transporter [Rhodobacteraceae bacterium]|nr:MATE family efflux transporter [Paracoccaceae bacterium]